MASGASIALNAWGCESTTATSKYVASVTTDANGVVTVKAQNFGDSLIDTKTITMTPYSDTNLTTAMTTAANAGAQVAGWKCGPGAGATGVDTKYLPGSCRG